MTPAGAAGTMDPRALLAKGRMTRAQMVVVLVTLVLNALDGFDVLSISFAAPGIAQEWGIERAALGVVLSMELLGMAIGSIAIGALADRLGRRRVVLGCLTLMAAGMALAAAAGSVLSLCVWRVLTGLGIGGMLASVNAVASEFSSDRQRDMSVSIMSIGFPLGSIAGGTVVAALLHQHSWHAIFQFGAAMTALFIPVVWWRLPESVVWLCDRQPPDALARINRALVRLGHQAVTALPPAATARPAAAPWRRGIFRPGFASTSVLLALTYFLHVTAFYFIVKWLPKLVVDRGFAASTAAGVLVWTNVGGALGGVVLGLLSRRFPVKVLTMIVLACSTGMIVLFGYSPPDIARLSLICAAAGFCTNGGIVGLYAVLARAYPPELRASGTGFTIGIGRGGSVLAPVLGGLLFQWGYPLPVVCFCMGAGPLVAAALLARLQVRSPEAA